MKKKVILIIQARMNSSRMPGKIMSKICDRPVIDYLIERVNRCRYIDDIVIATSTNELDDQIVSYCVKKSINYYRGSELDVLNRYYQASKQFKADIIVRITSDCPLIDPVIIDQVIQTYIQSKNQYDFISNTVPPPSNYPDGMDVEVFSYELLEKANFQSKLPSQREHVTFFMWKDNNFKTLKIDSNENFGKYRLTLDYQEDLYSYS